MVYKTITNEDFSTAMSIVYIVLFVQTEQIKEAALLTSPVGQVRADSGGSKRINNSSTICVPLYHWSVLTVFWILVVPA